MSIIEFSTRFHKALDEKDDSEIKRIYLEWIKKLNSEPLWTSKKLDDEFWRCSWKEAEDAFERNKEFFNSGGLYFFGNNEEILYIGLAGRELKYRLRKRYFGPKEDTQLKEFAQFKIAEKHEVILKKDGYKALPKYVHDWYNKNNTNPTTVRLRHAEKLAKKGIHEIWFAVLPLENKDIIERLEKELIRIAQPSLNTQNK